MDEKFEARLMELMLERSHWASFEDRIDVIEPMDAINCVRQMLNEFQAVIYQP